jgi:putative restriction endonuclease
VSPSSPDAQLLEQLSSLRQHQQDGRRSPHKPLLVLLALGRLAETGSSSLPWPDVEDRLADLIEEFGPTSKTGRAQSAAYPFSGSAPTESGRSTATSRWTTSARCGRA